MVSVVAETAGTAGDVVDEDSAAGAVEPLQPVVIIARTGIRTRIDKALIHVAFTSNLPRWTLWLAI